MIKIVYRLCIFSKLSKCTINMKCNLYTLCSLFIVIMVDSKYLECNEKKIYEFILSKIYLIAILLEATRSSCIRLKFYLSLKLLIRSTA